MIKNRSYYGLGWGLVKDLPNGEYAIHHGGSDMGVRTMAIFLPKSKRGIVVMTNGDNGMFVFNNIIIESIDIGKNILDIINKASDSPEIVTLSDGIIESYAGTYLQSGGRVINVAKEGNAIKVSGDGIPTAVLYPESKNKFFLKDFDVRLEFIKNESESTMHMIIHENGNQILDIKKVQ